MYMFLILEHVQVLAVNTAMVQGLDKSFDPCHRDIWFLLGSASCLHLPPAQSNPVGPVDEFLGCGMNRAGASDIPHTLTWSPFPPHLRGTPWEHTGQMESHSKEIRGSERCMIPSLSRLKNGRGWSRFLVLSVAGIS